MEEVKPPDIARTATTARDNTANFSAAAPLQLRATAPACVVAPYPSDGSNASTEDSMVYFGIWNTFGLYHTFCFSLPEDVSPSSFLEFYAAHGFNGLRCRRPDSADGWHCLASYREGDAGQRLEPAIWTVRALISEHLRCALRSLCSAHELAA